MDEALFRFSRFPLTWLLAQRGRVTATALFVVGLLFGSACSTGPGRDVGNPQQGGETPGDSQAGDDDDGDDDDGDDDDGDDDDGDDDEDDDDDDDGDDDDNDDDEGDGDSGTKFDIGDPEEDSDEGDTDCDEDDKPTPNAWVEGTVYAPNGTLPISGALVYAADQDHELDTIPDHVYCPECVELPCEMHWVLTEPDGSFRLPTRAGDDLSFVVAKGQFLRATQMDIPEGDTSVGADVTSLPDRRDEDGGMWIPNMAVGLGMYDRLEDALAKLGVADLQDQGTGDILDPGSESFDIWDNGGTGEAPGVTVLGTMQELLTDRDLMDKYHIIFFPCTSADALFQNATVVENVQDWVAEGGKLYAADWANEAVAEPFPQYQIFHEDPLFGGADLLSTYNTVGEVLDEDMLKWLDALPPEFKDINPQNGGGGHPAVDDLPNVDLWHNWSVVNETPEVQVEDADGNLVDVGHYIWTEGPAPGVDGVPPDRINPMTMTARYGCGKLMFTTYHTAENTVYRGLEPQELILMYLILEITVCEEDPPVDPPE